MNGVSMTRSEAQPKVVARVEPKAEQSIGMTFSKEQVALIKRTIARGATDDELSLFLGVAKRLGLDPFARQIYLIRRGGAATIQVSVDGFRSLAAASGQFEGSEGPFWCGPDGDWKDVWLLEEPPAAAKVGIWRAGCRSPIWGVARYTEYAGTSPLWQKMPATMLSKCSESLALRRAFPQELSGLHSTEEMEQGEPEAAAPPAEPTWSIKDMVASFQQLKERLGAGNEHLYYEILRQHGVAHSNEFRDPKLARAAYRQVLSRVMTVEDAAPVEPGDAA